MQEPYWFRKPLVLFQVPSAPASLDESSGARSVKCLSNAFWPNGSQPITHPTNINRLTRLAIVVIILLAVILRSWWPVAIGSGLMLLALIVGYGMQVQQDRATRERRAREYEFVGVNRTYTPPNATADALAAHQQHPPHAPQSAKSDDGANSMESIPMSAFASSAASSLEQSDFVESSAFLPNVDDTEAWGTTSVLSYGDVHSNPVLPEYRSDSEVSGSNTAAVGCANYPACGPGGPVACGSLDRDPRASIPNPSKHNTYDRVDARYQIYATKPQPVVAADNATLVDAQRESVRVADTPLARSDRSSDNASSGATGAQIFGIDPNVATPSQLPASYQQQNPTSASIGTDAGTSLYLSARSAQSDDRSASSTPPMVPPLPSTLPPDAAQPLTQTETMLERMYHDVDEYSWHETVAKRAPRWQQNPNDPRTRRKMEQDGIELQSWRGFNWSQGP